MRHRVASTWALLVAVCLPGPAAAGDIPRTASGRPDLGGNYDIASLTPFERDPKHGENSYLSPEEAADPPDGRLPPLTESGKERRAKLRPRAYKNDRTAWWMATGEDPYDNPEGLSLLDRCLYVGAATVPARPVAYNNLKTIVQTDTQVAINVEWMHWTRIIRLDSEHLPADLRSFGGDSIGWWEGDTLVVETTNLLAEPGVPREGLRVVERFSPIDARTILYRFTVHDPDYAVPYSGEFPWPRTDARTYEYACHEGNYSMANTLRGARQLELEWRDSHSGTADARPKD